MQIVNKPTIWSDIKKNRAIYLFVLPGVLFYIIFRYLPLYGVLIAFKDFRITRGILGSDWAGLKYFIQLFGTPDFLNVVLNTLLISIYKIVFSFPVPIIVAILLNEIKNKRFNNFTQSVIYMPYLISWVIIGGIVFNLLSIDGVVNSIRQAFGLQPVMFLGEVDLFRPIVVITDIWKNTGWSSIIYLATLTKISPDLYEAATIDGANWLQKTFRITIPGLSEVILVLFIISIGSLLYAGFDQVLVLYNPVVYDKGDILDTFIYRLGITKARFSYAAAAGLFQSVIAAVLIFSADTVSKKVSNKGLI